jgi:hypothetical protein
MAGTGAASQRRRTVIGHGSANSPRKEGAAASQATGSAAASGDLRRKKGRGEWQVEADGERTVVLWQLGNGGAMASQHGEEEREVSAAALPAEERRRGRTEIFENKFPHKKIDTK